MNVFCRMPSNIDRINYSFLIVADRLGRRSVYLMYLTQQTRYLISFYRDSYLFKEQKG